MIEAKVPTDQIGTDILMDHLDAAFDRFGPRVCVIQDDVELTYAQVQSLSRRVANGMIAAGIRPGMRVAIFSLNDYWAFICAIAIFRTGAIWVPINPRNSLDDNRALLNQFGCDGLIVGREFEKVAATLEADHPNVRFSVKLNGGEGEASVQNWIANQPDTNPTVSVKPTDIVTIPMTGGSTGLPKAVALSNRNMSTLAKARTMGADAPEDSVSLIAAPMTHAAGRGAIVSLCAGGRSIILRAVDLDDLLDAVEKHRVTGFFLPPTAIYTLLEHPRLDEIDFSSVKNFTYGSAPMSIDRLKEAIRRFGPIMSGGFGQTEAPMLISRLSAEDHMVDGEIASDERLRSVGKATAYSQLAILDDDGNELPPNERGEIAVKGDFVSEGYFENPEATAAIRLNGWHLTGDIGYLNDEGYLYIVDRKKDMIITGGFNVFSAEVERVVSAVPGVTDCVVIGVPDEKWGEAVKAVVVAKGDHDALANEIMDRCKAALGAVKSPKSVDFVDELPKNANSKVLKREVRQRYWEAAGRQI